MSFFSRAILSALLLLLLARPTFARELFVAIAGNDTNSGAADSPFRTIAKGITTAQAGDTVRVQPGSYDERPTTARGGTSDAARIILKADGLVTSRGFVVSHPYITVDGFDLTGHSGNAEIRAFIEVGANGDSFQVLNNTIRDGTVIIRDDFVFTDSGTEDTITSATGGFLAAGFKAGSTIRLMKGARLVNLKNSGSKQVASVTDNTITLAAASSLVNDGPIRAYLSGSYNFGVVINDLTTNGILRSNVFRNLSYDCAYLGGTNNVFEFNRFEQCNGWDAFHYSGGDNVYRRNLIINSPWSVHQISPDAMENWPTTPAARLLFEENFVIGFDGAMGVHHIQGAVAPNNGNLTFRRNVFIGGGEFAVQMRNVLFENNTFLNVESTVSEVISGEPHAIEFASFNGGSVRNNIFVGCGQGNNPNQQGWYKFGTGVVPGAIANNFVTGAGPAFAAKSGFLEGIPALSGGDPGFVNIADPLGPDGIAFTPDDGLQLRSDSKLRGAGEGGVDLGAYAGAAAPSLVITLQQDGKLRLAWPVAADGYALQSTTALGGNNWDNVSGQSVVDGNQRTLVVDQAGATMFFRLRQ